ncbi:protein-disulfide reductase DsbD domain-containing protein [Wenyingzhuangia sp. IMCC45467]
MKTQFIVKKMMLLFVLAISFAGQSQILKPVKWSTSVNKISEKEAELIATATIEEGWHLYSQHVPEGGPIATLFVFEGNGKYLKKGNTTEGKGHTIDDPIFEMKIKYFEKKAEFKQKIRLKSTAPFVVKGLVTFMVCDDSRCLPPSDVDLEFAVN